MIDNNNSVRPKNMCMELAEAIHWDVGKGKREKKERGGGSVGVGNNNDASGFAVG